MAIDVTNYKCPACTGPLHYSGNSGKLECEYCGSSFEVEEIEAIYAPADELAEVEEAKAPGEDWGEEAEKLCTYSCPSCGAELICDMTTAATSCPYCGNPSIIPGVFEGGMKPDMVLPFKLDKKAAIAALKQFYKGKRLLPKEFSDKNHIEEIKGVYVPFWLYDGVGRADISYNATRVFSAVAGDMMVTTTEHYRLRRAGNVNFEKVPVDASSKMPDAHMDSIEPFDYFELKPFSTAYLAGYMADKYDMSMEDSRDRAALRIANTVESMVSNTAFGYTTCSEISKNVNVKHSDVNYVLLPVWMLSTKWNGNNYLFAMNGQTGKLIGDLPVCKKRLLEWFFKIWAPLAAVLAVLMFFA